MREGLGGGEGGFGGNEGVSRFFRPDTRLPGPRRVPEDPPEARPRRRQMALKQTHSFHCEDSSRAIPAFQH